MRLAVCWKVVAATGTGAAPGAHDTRWAGVSAADEAALEVALTLRDRATGSTVDVVSLGPPTADDVLRRAIAVGADRVVRIDAPTTLDGAEVAEALAAVVEGCDLVLCGDYSHDRGTGSVPAFVAARLGWAQALGLVGLDLDSSPEGGRLRVVRRLDGGRRELLAVAPPAVLSVEGSVASLRRAGLAPTIAARTAPVEVVGGPRADPQHVPGVVTPYRPRARVLAPPAGDTLDRMRDILHVGGDDSSHAETVTLEPRDAATRLLGQLREWGYLDADPPPHE